MEIKDLMETIKLQLTGGILNFEISDENLEKIINLSLDEMNHYYNVTELITVPSKACIDLKEYPLINTVVNVYRVSHVGQNDSSDPVQMSQLQMYTFGSSYYDSSWIYNIGAWNTAQQIKNTLSTDLIFKQDRDNGKLYINFSCGTPQNVTIEYTPRLMDVSQIKSPYWIGVLEKIVMGHTKVTLGRIRTRFTQEGAQWTGDGATILEEGKTELKEVFDRLNKSVDLTLPLD